MRKLKIVTTVTPHYIGNKSLSEAFSSIIKHQIETNILQNTTIGQDNPLNITTTNGKMALGNLLSESEDT